MKDLLACRETRSRPVADIEEGHVSTTACILANIAMKLGRTLEWDAGEGAVVGDEEANAPPATAVPRALGAPRGMMAAPFENVRTSKGR